MDEVLRPALAVKRYLGLLVPMKRSDSPRRPSERNLFLARSARRSAFCTAVRSLRPLPGLGVLDSRRSCEISSRVRLRPMRLSERPRELREGERDMSDRECERE